MKAVMVMYDSLRRMDLPCYGGKEIELPNFRRLAQHTAVFDNSYVCSMPCMPARREIHTGRANFLHRSWGPLEPFDDSMPEILKQNGIYTRIVTDHNHYVEDGGGTYLPRYSTWECSRGQEGDPWQASAGPLPVSTHSNPISEHAPEVFRKMHGKMHGQDMLNRASYHFVPDYPQARTFAQGAAFIEQNYQYDNWFLQIETFDPHEPFDTPDSYISRICDPDTIGELDWPPYAPVTETEEEIRSFRMHYLALLGFCDDSLGKVLDCFDKYDLWKDTMLIVNTDHGYLLGEHGWWSKGMMPDYQEVIHTPLFIWDPRSGVQNVRRQALVQTIDLAPTLLDLFGIDIPEDMLGKPLAKTVKCDEAVREYALSGFHGGTLNITDGRYKLMLAIREDAPQGYDYTLMPTHMRARFSVQELQKAEWREPFSFTKGCSVIAVPTPNKYPAGDVLRPGCELLFDLENDPEEMHPIKDETVTKRLKQALIDLLKENDAPAELYDSYNF
ncbi:MAG: sulfatase-like hydrolase/transferase [Erysipelotrichaceae bacterium]|nr:sulfatase-like hydrolase/transferase [Erysipelotrichaceae bacterium]